MFSCMLTFAMCRGRCNKPWLRKFNTCITWFAHVVSIFQLVSVSEQAGLRLTFSHNVKIGILAASPIL